jgi:hypothetical protein
MHMDFTSIKSHWSVEFWIFKIESENFKSPCYIQIHFAIFQLFYIRHFVTIVKYNYIQAVQVGIKKPCLNTL